MLSKLGPLALHARMPENGQTWAEFGKIWHIIGQFWNKFNQSGSDLGQARPLVAQNRPNSAWKAKFRSSSSPDVNQVRATLSA